MHNHLPDTVETLFENQETEYSYFSETPLDNIQSMAWFIEYLDLEKHITLYDGTQIFVNHPSFKETLRIDAGGLGDFFSHSFTVSIKE